MKALTAIAAALSLAATPALAQAAKANGAASLSLAHAKQARAQTKAENGSRLTESTTAIVGVLAVTALVIGGIAIAKSGDGPDSN